MKKGYIKTLEVIITVVMTFIMVMFIIPTRFPQSTGDDLNLLEFLSEKDSFRACVIAGNDPGVQSEIDYYMPRKYNFTYAVADPGKQALPGLPRKRVFVDSVFIQGNESVDNPKVVRLYYWTR